MEKIKQGHEGYFRQGSHAVSLKRSHEAKPPVTDHLEEEHSRWRGQ